MTRDRSILIAIVVIGGVFLALGLALLVTRSARLHALGVGLLTSSVISVTLAGVGWFLQDRAQDRDYQYALQQQRDLRGFRIENHVIRNISLANHDLSQTNILGTRFGDSTSLFDAKLDGSYLERVDFGNSNLFGVSVCGSVLFDVDFDSVKGMPSDFSQVLANQRTFDSLKKRSVDLAGVSLDLSGVTLYKPSTVAVVWPSDCSGLKTTIRVEPFPRA